MISSLSLPLLRRCSSGSSTLSPSPALARRTLSSSQIISRGVRSKSRVARNTSPKSRRSRVHQQPSVSVVGMSPAWKRYYIISQKRKSLHVNAESTPNATTAIAIAIPPKETNFALIIDQIKSFSIGSVAGLLGSLAGMGGGFVMIPMMTATRLRIGSNNTILGGLGLHQHQAHGTSLFAVGTTGLAGALGYGITLSGGNDNADTQQQSQKEQESTTCTSKSQKSGLVELDTAIALATTAMITARFGAIASSKLSEKALQKALGAFMIFVAPLVPGKAYIESWRDINHPDMEQHYLAQDAAQHPNHNQMSQLEQRLLPASLIGIFSGFLSGMFGVGGGAIVVPSLVLSTDMTYHSALGTSLCAMVLPAMVGTYYHSMKGNVNWRVGPMLALGSAAGAFYGGREVGLNLDENVLRAGFSCLMFVLGVRTWRKGSR